MLIAGETWEKQLADRIHSVRDSFLFPFLQPEQVRDCEEAEARFSVLVPRYYYSLMNQSDPGDPLARQVFPLPEEGSPQREGDADPLGEWESMPVRNCIHKYRDRVVLLVSSQCAVHCRHCNRRAFIQSSPQPGREDRARMLAYVGDHCEIRDVILSGGDPLMLSDEILEELLREVRAIPHVEMVRIGTRIPVILPQRITEPLTTILERYGPLWVNTQFNHPAEITPQAALAVERLVRAGIPVNNQAVLLRGVNDDPVVLRNLSLQLLRIRVRPYYLFQCDPVSGACHFTVPEEIGMELVDGLKEDISGLGVPFYVRDTRAQGKILLAPRSGEGVFPLSLLYSSKESPAHNC